MISMLKNRDVLAGTFSIEIFPQPNTNGDTLTFTIKETGLTQTIPLYTITKITKKTPCQIITNTLQPIKK